MPTPDDRPAKLISVVVPVYNHERFVAPSLESVFSQGHRPLQLIVIDDGSRDGSAAAVQEVLGRHRDETGIEVAFRSRENRGAHATLNEGLAAATGDYVAILNSDDFYHPQRLEKLLAACETSGAALAFSYVEPVGEDGASLPADHPWRGWYDAARLSELAVAPTVGFVLFEHNLAVSSGNLFFRRSLLDRIGPFRDFVIAHDLDFLLRALRASEPFLVKEKLYFYRLHGANTFQSQVERTEAELERIYGDYLRAVAERPPENPLAPCHQHWPASWERCLRSPRLGRALDSLVPRPAEPVEASAREPVWRGSHAPAAPPRGEEVTVITHELSLSGAPKVALELTAMLLAQGCRVNVVSLFDGPLRRTFGEIGVPVIVLQTRLAGKLAEWVEARAQAALKTGGPARAWRAARFAARRLAAWAGGLPLFLDLPVFINLLLAAPQVRRRVMVNSFGAWPVVLPLSRLRSFQRLAWFIHESFDPRLVLPGWFFRDALAALAREPGTRLAFGSEATRQIWAKAGFEGITRYWSGLPREACAPVARAPGAPMRNLLTVGSSSGRKGTRDLVEALALAIREGWVRNDVTLTVVGVEPPSRKAYAADLLRRARQADLAGRVRLVPAVEAGALDAYYREADLYVQSSRTECLPLSLLTAMAYGLPIVTTDADGCREAITEGCGRVVAPRGLAVLARAIADALADPAGSRAQGAAARERFLERFALEATEAPLREVILG
jgi:glycosyltransferase involved in cell wall biosynthesis